MTVVSLPLPLPLPLFHHGVAMELHPPHLELLGAMPKVDVTREFDIGPRGLELDIFTPSYPSLPFPSFHSLSSFSPAFALAQHSSFAVAFALYILQTCHPGTVALLLRQNSQLPLL